MEDSPFIEVDDLDEDVNVEANKTMIDTYFKQPWGDGYQSYYIALYEWRYSAKQMV